MEKVNNEILKMMNDPAIFPELEESEVGVSTYTKIPLSNLSSYGVAFQPLVVGLQSMTINEGGSGFYFVNNGGKSMFHKTGTSDFIGSLQTVDGKVGGGQALITNIPFDPKMMFMAGALANIDKKLDAIKDMQKEMMDFLVQKEESKLKGNLKFLEDIFNNYKYNWDNKMYTEGNYTKALDIRQNAEQQIIFYREQIISQINKKELFHGDQAVSKQLKTVEDLFKNYQLALYLLGASSFIEVMMLGNFNSEYLSEITSKLEDYSSNYRFLYTVCYDQIEQYSSSSIESSLLKGISKVSASAGKFIGKIPAIKEGPVDEALIAAGDKLNDINGSKVKNQMDSLIEHRNNYIKPFVDNINMINDLHNKPVRIIADKENIYIAS